MAWTLLAALFIGTTIAVAVACLVMVVAMFLDEFF